MNYLARSQLFRSTFVQQQRKWLFASPFTVSRRNAYLGLRSYEPVNLPAPVFDKNQFESLQTLNPLKAVEYMQNYNLLVLQKRFYDDPANTDTHYHYFKELNRQKKHAKVIELYFNYTERSIQNMQQDSEIVGKILQQVRYAEVQSGLSTIQLSQFESGGKKQSLWSQLSIFKKLLVIYTITEFRSHILIWYFEIDFTKEEGKLDNNSYQYPGFVMLFKKLLKTFNQNHDDNSKHGKKDQENKEKGIITPGKLTPPQPGPPPKSGGGFISKMFDRSGEIEEQKNIPTRFKDVLGIDEFKEELTELVDFLKNPKKYQEAGAKLPKGILLVGPPGTGKTLLARALAGEAGCSFYYKSGSEFDEMFVGVGASRVRELFKKARQTAPSIIFIDEIDSVCGKRSATDQSHSRDTVNQILAEMDGFKDHENVIVIGATNFEKSLDSAVKRPGRFDKTIHVPYPDVRGREQLFEYYLAKIEKHEEVSSKELAKQTSGFTGADIQNMVNVAVLNAIKNKDPNSTEKLAANKKDFDFALDRISMGIGRKNMFITDADKLKTAYHEGGHTITAVLTKEAMPLHKVTILPRGGALGFTSFVPETDQLNYTKRGMIASIDVAMGGRVAEELYYGNSEITTGCSNDLQKATEMAYSYVKEYGMDENLTLISQQGNGVKTSDQYNYKLDKEVQRLLKESYERVKVLLKSKDKALQDLAEELIKHETLDAQQVRNIIFQGKPPSNK